MKNTGLLVAAAVRYNFTQFLVKRMEGLGTGPTAKTIRRLINGSISDIITLPFHRKNTQSIRDINSSLITQFLAG
jgi:hypothetical protein